MSALAPTSLTLAAAARIIHEAVRDRSYERTPLGPFVRDYLAWKKLSRASDRTLDGYERYLAKLALHTAHLELLELDVADLMLVLQTHPPGSWRPVRAAWNGFFTWAVRFGHRETNPMDRLPPIRQEPQRIYELFTAAERAQVVKATDDSLLPVRDRLGALIFQDLGVRKSEGRRLRLGSFDLIARTVIVFGKGSKERVVPFSDDLWTALMDFAHTPIPKVRMQEDRETWLEERTPLPGDFVFFPSGAAGRHGARGYGLLWTDPTRPMSETAMHRWWQRCVERAGIHYRSLHMNRHTVGTELVEADVDPFSVRDWLGHADVRTTEMYVHNSRTRLRKAAERLRVARREMDAE